jgi:hypothetical protein
LTAVDNDPVAERLAVIRGMHKELRQHSAELEALVNEGDSRNGKRIAQLRSRIDAMTAQVQVLLDDLKKFLP